MPLLRSHYDRMMKIALDATPLTVPTGGVRRYTEELSCALAENFPEDEFWLLSDQPFNAPAPRPANLNTGRGPRNAVERRWWLRGLNAELSRLGIDVFHGTDFAVPYLAARPAVMTIHDLSPWMDPAWHNQSRRVRGRTPKLLRWGLATMVITPSEAIKRQAIDRFHLNPGRVVAVPLAAARIFRPMAALPDGRPYLLYVGTLEPRKNLGFLLDVWRQVRRNHAVELVVAGRRRSDFDGFLPEPGLHVEGLVPDEELPKLYSGALACLYPSCYEGFGLPVLEAMQCGAVVIASQDAAIAEVANDAAILLNVNERRAWVETLDSLIARPEQFRTFREKAIARAAQFSWSKTAKLTREVYAHAAGIFRKS
jgi:glycosyltransferase involved in cell wall biosynthesis